ncbi:MAG: acetolactate synthase-1/2/3 large subunit [Phenylobacterium sp.]|jgi:acetolactate synthase-1/2/3 large subunit
MGMTEKPVIEGELETAEVYTTADLIVEYLYHLGVEFVFGVPGGAIEPLYNALARSERNGGPRAIVARHESGAAFMADGYARETGKLGVVCATTGPGSTNLITGVANALADNIPLLVITAQTPLPKFGKGALQDSSCSAIDTVGMFRHCTRFNTLVSHAEQLESKLISALMATHRIPKGPVHISVPADILRQDSDSKPHVRPEALLHDFTLKDKAALDKLNDELGKVDKIVLFLGDGCGTAADEIMRFAELVNAPFATGPMGKRWVDETHPLFRGVFGFAGHKDAQELFKNEEVELVLAIGASLGEIGTGGWADSLLNERMIHIDSSVEHFTRSPMAKLHVCGHLKAVFNRLIDNVQQARNWGRTWNGLVLEDHSDQNPFGGKFVVDNLPATVSDAVPIKPQRLFTQLAKVLPDGTRAFFEAGNSWAWGTHYYQRTDSDGSYRIAMGFGSMGWAIGASIGSALAKTKHPTVCFTGDGSYLMSGQEITSAAQQKTPVVFIVLNDAVLGMVMHGQRMGGAEPIGYALNKINYAAMVEAMGIEGIVVETPQELDALDFDRLFAKDSPTLIDVRIDAEEVPPMGSRVKDLAAGESATPGG